MNPAQRSMNWYRENGYEVEKVEQQIKAPGFFIRKDFIGFADLYAFKPGSEDELCQVTTMSNASNHLKKLSESTETKKKLKTWLASSHHKAVFHLWRKKGEHGKRKLWALEIRPICIINDKISYYNYRKEEINGYHNKCD